MRILLVDDHELFRNGLLKILSDEFPFAEIHEACNGLTAEKMARAEDWDIIITDMAMPDKPGLDVLKQLRTELNKTPILILSNYPENQYALRVLKAGGNGYIRKDCAIADFITAVRIILKGKKYISPEIAEKLASRFDIETTKEEYELISDREMQVLKLIAEGKAVSEIANLLSLSITTVSTYRARLLGKMHLKNNAELALYAINNLLV